MLDDLAIGHLRDDLEAASFTLDDVTARLGAEALAALARNTTLAADHALADCDDPQATLIRLWALGRAVDAGAAQAALPSSLTPLLDAGLVALSNDRLAATVELKPYGWGPRTGWVCSDQTPLDHAHSLPRDDFVLGGSPASATLAQLTVRRPVASALDLGTGSGIQALHLADHCQRIVSTDLNPRALALARLTLALNGVHTDLRLGSLYDPVAEDAFDLIVSNPPYVMAPPDDAHLLYREGGFAADGLMRAIIAGAPDHLTDGGLLHVVGNWAITADEPWEDRLAGWIGPTGCDALVLRRETLDPYEYVELWLADAGLATTGNADAYRHAYRHWIDYFDALGITGVGMGWISLRKARRDTPAICIEDWPHAVAQPVGPDVGRFFDVIDTARLPDDALAATRLALRADVVQETYGRPGEPDPEHIVIRQTTGLCRAAVCDTATAAVLGACDGDLSLGALADATAALLDADPTALRATVFPNVRDLTEQGFLEPPDA